MDARNHPLQRAPTLAAGPAIARIAPFAAFIALIAFDGVLTQLATRLGVDPRWVYAVRVAVAAALLAAFWRQYRELRAARRASGWNWLLAVLVGIAVFVLWINLDFAPLALGHASGYDPRVGGTVDWGFASLRLLGAVVVVPVMEELFWRSFILRWIRDRRFEEVAPRAAGLRALVVSSALFALEHHLWFAGLLAGLAYGGLYMRTGNLWLPIVSHAVTNALLGGWVLHTERWELW